MRINDQILFKFEKPFFWPISSVFGSKKVFSKNSGSGTHNFIRVSSTSTRVRISNDPIPTKHLDIWQDGKTERLLPATARGLPSITAVDWHLKVKDIEYDDGLTKNYCITVSMQKINSIPAPILKGAL